MRLIDADALIDSMTGVINSLEAYGFDTIIGRMLITVAENAPTVEPKRGRWVKMTGMMPPEYHGHYECSECGWHMKGLRNSWTREEEMAYCPNCGKKMDGGEIDEMR